jgi:hypothetical protein
MSTIALNCLVSGDGPGKIFTVEIPSDKNVSILKDLIKEKAHPDFSSVAARNIQLFKLKVSLAPDEASRVSDPLQNDAVEELSSPLAKISAIFTDLPDDKVHVIVLAPTGERRVLFPLFLVPKMCLSSLITLSSNPQTLGFSPSITA